MGEKSIILAAPLRLHWWHLILLKAAISTTLHQDEPICAYADATGRTVVSVLKAVHPGL